NYTAISSIRNPCFFNFIFIIFILVVDINGTSIFQVAYWCEYTISMSGEYSMPSSTGWFSAITIVHANDFGKFILSGTTQNIKRQINAGHYEMGNLIAILLIHI